MDGRGRMAAAPDVLAALSEMERLANEEGQEHWRETLNLLVKDQDRGMKKGFRGWQDNMAILNEDVPFDTVKINFLMYSLLHMYSSIYYFNLLFD